MEHGAPTYLGVDVVRQGSRLSDFVYSVAVVRGGTLLKVDEVSASRLVRMLWELRPDALAVDNVLELGGSLRNLSRFAKLLPPGVRLLQVNVDERGLRDLRVAAREAGVELPHGKPDSRLSAALVAFLASRGFGREVELFSKKVKIYVYPGRSGRAGGSSADRFKRNLRAAVAQTVRKIEEALRSASIDYDVTLRRSRGGIGSAVFTAYCDRERLHGLVRSSVGHDVVVRIRPVVNPAFVKSLLSTQRDQRYLVVGIDPGIEVGLAALDLDGRVVALKSARGLDREDVVSLLLSLGRVVIVATDRQQPPEFVKRVAAALGAKLYSPERDLTTYEKESIAREYAKLCGVEIKDSHVRDSLAAAVEALRSIERKMKELEEELAEMGLDRASVTLDAYKARIAEGVPVASVVEEVIADALSGAEPAARVLEAVREVRALTEENESLRKRVEELERALEALSLERRQLLGRVKSLEEELSRLRSVIDSELASISRDLMRDRKVYELAQRLANAVRDLDSLRLEHERVREQYARLVSALAGIAEGKLIAIRSVGTPEQVRELEGVKQGDMVFVENPTLESIRELAPLVEKLGIGLVLPDAVPDDALHEIVDGMAVPAVRERIYCALEGVAVVSSSVRRRMAEVAERVKRIREEREASRRGLSVGDLEEIIREYRELRRRLDEESEEPPRRG